MEKTFLLSSGFEYDGYGAHWTARGILDLNIGFVPVCTDEVKFKFRKSILNVYSFYYIEKKYKTFKGQKVLVTEPYLLPKKSLRIPIKKAVIVHDFYVFNKDYISNIKKLPIKKRLFRTLFLLRKLQKSYNNIKFYDNVIVFDLKAKYRLVKEFGVDGNKISVFQVNIIDNSYQPSSNKQKNNEKKIIGYINGFGANKAEKLRLFIEHFKNLKDNSIEFHICGKGFPFSDLIKRDSRIKYFGFLPEERIVETYNSFDVYLSTSTMEGFGLPIMKAKACKVPVLCYDGDLIDIVKRNTLVWNENNIDEILKNKEWNRVDVEKAYEDVEETRPAAVKKNMQHFLESF